jgi:hypothetical protein
MSDCPECDNVGYIDEFVENLDDEDTGTWYRRPCRGWRHRMRPTLEEIASALREGREPPHSHLLPLPSG